MATANPKRLWRLLSRGLVVVVLVVSSTATATAADGVEVDTGFGVGGFTATGTEGFGRTPNMTEADYLEHFLATYSHGLRQMLTSPTGLDRIIVRYEDLVVQAKRIGDWLGVELDAAQVETNRDDYRHHMTTNTVTESVGRWRHDLTPNEAQLVSDTLRDLAKPFGYRL